MKNCIFALTVTADPALNVNLSANNVNLPATVTLTLTDTHTPGPLIPGLWYDVTVEADGGGELVTEEIGLLVGGYRLYAPFVKR